MILGVPTVSAYAGVRRHAVTRSRRLFLTRPDDPAMLGIFQDPRIFEEFRLGKKVVGSRRARAS